MRHFISWPGRVCIAMLHLQNIEKYPLTHMSFNVRLITRSKITVAASRRDRYAISAAVSSLNHFWLGSFAFLLSRCSYSSRSHFATSGAARTYVIPSLRLYATAGTLDVGQCRICLLRRGGESICKTALTTALAGKDGSVTAPLFACLRKKNSRSGDLPRPLAGQKSALDWQNWLRNNVP